MRVSAPFDDTTRASPVMGRVVRIRPGSALGLSQPLSGFLAGSSSTALFHAAAVPGLLPPSEPSPRRDRDPSRGRLLPGRYPPTCWKRASRDRSPPVSATHTPKRARRLPPTTMASLSASRSPLPGPPGSRAAGTAPFRRLRRLRSLAPPTSPFVPAWVTPHREPLLSWSFRPSRDSASKPSEPPTRSGPHDPGTDDRPQTTARDTADSAHLRRGARRPRRQVRPHRAPKRPTRTARQSPAPFGTGPRRLSTASPAPSTFRTPGRPDA